MVSVEKKNKMSVKFIFKDLHNAVNSYKGYRNYMGKLGVSKYSRRFYRIRHLENQKHNDYSFYINDAIDRLRDLFKIYHLDWDKYLKAHNIIFTENYSDIILKDIKQDIKDSESREDEHNNIIDTLDLASTNRNSHIQYNVHNDENRTDTSVNIFTISEIYNDLQKKVNDDYLNNSVSIMDSYKKQWKNICKSLLKFTDEDIDINYVN